MKRFEYGNVSVLCYEFVFNIGAASGASYGGYKLSMVVVNAVTSAMLLHKRARTIRITKILIGVFIVACFVAFVMVQGGKQFSSSDGISTYAQMVMALVAMFH